MTNKKPSKPRKYRRKLQKNNIAVAKTVEELVKSTLGPCGMKKLIMDQRGVTVATSDGSTILRSVQTQNPIMKIMREAAETQDDEVGDGTTTMLIIAGELLRNAEELLDEGIHPTLIVSGYRRACNRAIRIMKQISIPIQHGDREVLKKAAITSMRSKDVGVAEERLARIAVKAIESILEMRQNEYVADVKNVQIVKRTGKSLLDTQLSRGVIIEKPVLHGNMPKRIENAKILLLESALEISKDEFFAEIQTNPNWTKSFINEEVRRRQMWVEKIRAFGANVILCQKGIDVKTQDYLARHGIMGAHWVMKRDMERAARATGGKIVINLANLRPEDLGTAGVVEERRLGKGRVIFIEACKDPKSVSILVRAGSDKVLDEAERALNDALHVVASMFLCNKIVGGGGALEVELARRLRSYARKVSSKEQLAIEAYANSLEAIPKVLAENAGLDQIDVILTLRSRHERRKGLWIGVNTLSRNVESAINCGIIEPLFIKERILKTATEVASIILRTGDVISVPSGSRS